MFIKKAYQKRIAQQKQKQLLLQNIKAKRPPKIGSAKNDKINFDRNQQFFNHDDVTLKGRIGKQFKMDFTDPNILQLKKRPWNMSVEVPKRFQDQQSWPCKLLKIRKGMSDYVQVPYRPNKIYQGTQTRDNFNNWNVSTFVTKRQINKGLQQTNMNAWNNSGLYAQTKLSNYLKPIQRYQISENLRKKDIQLDASLSQTFRSDYQFNNPFASSQKANAVAFKFLEQSKIQRLKDSLSNMDTATSLNNSFSFKAKLSPTQKDRIKIYYQHTGVWHKVKFSNYTATQSDKNNDQDEQYAWSCCMNSDQQSKGCVKRILDGNKLNFSSYNNA